MNIVEFLSQPWHWSVSGALIALTMLLLILFGSNFGVSGTYRTICAMGGAGKSCDFFDFDWKNQLWNLVFVGGAIVGGLIASTLLASPKPVQISDDTIRHLSELGVKTPVESAEGAGFIPLDIFNFENLLSAQGIIMMVLGGFLIGFGTRYAGGCTSGHAISGLSDLQWPSLLAVVGFFIGGLLMTWVFLPFILSF